MVVSPNCGAFISLSPALVTGKGVLLHYSQEDETKWRSVEISAVTPHKYYYSDHTYAILVCRACDEYFVAQKKEYNKILPPRCPNLYYEVSLLHPN